MVDFPQINELWSTFTAYDDIQVVNDQRTVNLKHLVTTGDNSKTNIVASTRPLTTLETKRLQGFFKEVKGRGIFQLSIPQGTSCTTNFDYEGSAVSPNTAYTTTSNHVIGNSIINLSSAPTESILPIGSYLQFRSGGKLHQVIAISGSTMTISPSLYEDVASGSNVLLTNLVGTYRMKNGAPTAQQQYVRYFAFGFEFEEELP